MNIYNLGNRIVNNYLFPTANGYVLIDTGYENGYRRFCNKLSKLNISIKEIKYVFLTHAHDDHAGFLKELLTQSPWIKVIVHKNAIVTLKKGQNSFEGGCAGRLAYTFCLIMKLLGKGQHRFPSIEEDLFEHFITITEKNKEVLQSILHGEIMETPGHTQDSISLMIDESILFCGDAAMNGIPSMNKITIWIENREQYRETWTKIIALNPKLIYSGHGKPFNSSDLLRNISQIKKRKLYKLQ